MKRFEFKLARLARVRRIEEELARAAWQAAEADARRAEERLQDARGAVHGATDALRLAQASEQLAPLEILNIDATIARLARRVIVVRAEVSQARAAAEAMRKPWSDLRVELEGLNRLEDKARTRHRIEHERVEMLEMDQLASERAARGGLDILRGPDPRFTSDLRRRGA